MANYRYPATLEPAEGGATVISFRDVPEANTVGWSPEEIAKNAKDALITALDFYIEDGRELPEPSKLRKGDLAVDLPLSVAAKVMLLNAMVKSNVRPADLARKMRIKPQEVTRLMDLNHSTKIDTVQNAMKVLGKELFLNVR